MAWKVLHPETNYPAVFTPGGLLDKLLNKLSYPGLGRPMDFIPRDPSCCSFHTSGSFLLLWYPALKMTAPLFSLTQKSDLLDVSSNNIEHCNINLNKGAKNKSLLNVNMWRLKFLGIRILNVMVIRWCSQIVDPLMCGGNKKVTHT